MSVALAMPSASVAAACSVSVLPLPSLLMVTGEPAEGLPWTSVARMVTGLLVAQGVSTGTYTSPNLERVNERIGWNGQEIDDDTLTSSVRAAAKDAGFSAPRPVIEVRGTCGECERDAEQFLSKA